MCQNSRFVFNSYIRKRVLVSCGVCPACQQEKANARAMRIRNHTDGKLCLFVMLSYENRFVPYIHSDDLVGLEPVSVNEQGKTINVYRDCSVRWYGSHKIVKNDFSLVRSFNQSDFLPYQYDVPQLRKKSGCVGVIYWKDVQNFIKRLRINLLRNGFNPHLSYWASGEYGERTHRPHFHLLLYFSEGSFETLKPLIVKSWPYGDMLRSRKRIQVAIDAAGYVASYVNKSANLPEICTSSVIRQKHSHSLYFGHNLQSFSLPSLLEKADSQDMCYTKEILNDGKSLLVNVPIPKYVINRYFPKFKGFSSFSPSEIQQLLRFPQNLWDKLGDHCDLPVFDGSLSLVGFSRQDSGLIMRDLMYNRDQFRSFQVHLMHCYGRYWSITGKSIYDYAIDYQRVWMARFCYVFKHSFDIVKDITDFGHFYENANEFVYDPRIAPTLPHPDLMYYEQNPNKRADYVLKHNNLVDLFNKKQNLKEINNIALSSYDDEF